MGKYQKYNKHHQQEPRGQPFPSRWPQGSNELTQKHEKHDTKNTNDPQQKYCIGTVSKKNTGGLKPVSRMEICHLLILNEVQDIHDVHSPSIDLYQTFTQNITNVVSLIRLLVLP